MCCRNATPGCRYAMRCFCNAIRCKYHLRGSGLGNGRFCFCNACLGGCHACCGLTLPLKRLSSVLSRSNFELSSGYLLVSMHDGLHGLHGRLLLLSFQLSLLSLLSLLQSLLLSLLQLSLLQLSLLLSLLLSSLPSLPLSLPLSLQLS